MNFIKGKIFCPFYLPVDKFYYFSKFLVKLADLTAYLKFAIITIEHNI